AVSVPLSKRSVYLPTSPLIASPLNVAAPLPVVVAAAFVSVAPVGPVAITAVTVVPAWLTALPFASRSCSTGCGVNATPLCAVAGGGVLIVTCVAAPAVPVTGTEPFTMAVTVFVPAAVELKAPVIWPLVLVVPAGCVSVMPVTGFAASVTVAPLTGLPFASFTVTVIVLALEPELAVIVPGDAATSD